MSALAPELVKLRDGREVIIRPMVPDDAEAVLRYMHEGLPEFSEYITTAMGEYTLTVEEERQRISTLNPASGCLRLIALAEDQIVGSLGCDARPRRRIAHVGHLGMTTRQAYWDTGLGSAMMACMVDWAIAHPVLELLELSVYADNPRAIALYRKFSFKESDRLPRGSKFGPNRYKDNVHMYRSVDGADE